MESCANFLPCLFGHLEERVMLTAGPDVTLGTITSSTVTLNWTAVQNASAIRVYLAAEPSAVANDDLPGQVLLAALAGSATSYQVSNLAPAVDGFFRVEADIPGTTTGTNVHARTVGGPMATLDNPVQEIHGYGPNILQIVVSDLQLDANGTGNNGVAWQEGAWRIKRSDGTDLNVLNVYRHSLPMQAPSYSVGHGSPNSDNIIEVDHRLYLVLGENIGDRDVLTIEGPFATQIVLPFSDKYLETPILQVNQVGYSPLATQRWAYVSGWMGDGGGLFLSGLSSTAQVLVEPADALTARTAILSSLPITLRSSYDSAAGGEVREIDLSQLPAAEGVRYRVQIPNVGVSWVTAVSYEALFKAYFNVARGVTHNRFGRDLTSTYSEWDRPADHTTIYTADGNFYTNPYYQSSQPQTGSRAFTGGYHNAGDFDIMPEDTATTVALLRAYESNPSSFSDNQLYIPEYNNSIPDQLDEALWGVLGWENLQESDDGGVRSGVQSFRHPVGIFYADTDPDPYWTFSRDAQVSARAAGIFAQAAWLISSYDANRASELTQRARDAYTYAKNNSADTRFLIYGASELWRLTGETAFKTDFETYFDSVWSLGYSKTWNINTLLPDYVLGYAQAAGSDSTRVSTITTQLGWDAENIVAATLNNHAHRNARPVGGAIGWGYGSIVSMFLDPLQARLTLGNLSEVEIQRYYDTLSLNADFMLGANPFGYVWFTGLGSRNPENALMLDSLSFLKDGNDQIPGIPVFGVSTYPDVPWEQSAKAAFYPYYSPSTFATAYPDGYKYGGARTLVESSETGPGIAAPAVWHLGSLLAPGMMPPSSWLPGGSDVRNPIPGGMTPTNNAPTVRAGIGQSVYLSDAADLDGIVFDDNFNGSTLTTTWSKVSGPGSVTFGNASHASTTATFSAIGTYVLKLTGSDGTLQTSDNVTVFVSHSEERAADDAVIALYHFNGDLTDSAWDGLARKGSGYDFTAYGSATTSDENLGWMTNASGAALKLTGAGDYVIATIPDSAVQGGSVKTPIDIEARLYISGYPGNGTAYDLVSLYQHSDAFFRVHDPAWGDPFVQGNSTTLVSAADWATYFTTGEWHTLRITFDAAGLTKVYIDGIERGSATTSPNVSRATDWTLRLGHFTGYVDEVRILSRVDGVNIAPSVEAGANQSILKNVSWTALLQGFADDDGLPLSPGSITTTWSKVSGPGTVIFGNANHLSTTATFSVSGTYVLRLTASDGSLYATDDLTIVCQNARPVVYAGADQDEIALTFQLNATASDDGLPASPGSITTAWSKVSGPGTATFGNANSLNTTVTFSRKGTYVLALTAFDGEGASRDEITIKARPGGQIEYTNDADTVVLYHFNDNLNDSSSNGYNLTAYGNAVLASDDLSWMTHPSGKALKVTGKDDYASITGISDSLIMPSSPRKPITIEARLFIKGYTSQTTDYELVGLTQAWDSFLRIFDPGHATPFVQGGASPSVTLVSSADWQTHATLNEWHFLKITFDTNSLATVYLNEVEIGSQTVSSNINRTTPWTLTLGHFDGYIDEVRISNVIRPHGTPSVNAGSDATVYISNGASLDATVTDVDSIPHVTWSKLSGPGTVTFSDSHSVKVDVGFSQTGTYVLRLTANDGFHEVYDDVTITVNQDDEFTNDANTTALYHFNNDYNDSSDYGYNLTVHGNATLANDNLDWMTIQAGKALRVYSAGDYVTVDLPDSAVMPGSSASALTIEARFYVHAYVPNGLGNYNLISLFQAYDALFRVYDAKWADPVVSGNGVDVVSGATWASNVSKDTWHSLKITFDANATVSCYIDGNLIGSLTQAANYSRTSAWTLTLGNFDGYIDEVRISNTVR